MEVRSLEGIPLSEIIDCFLEAFSTYELKMPEDLDYWAWRFNAARVDFSMSFGAFLEEKMLAFIIIGVDELNGAKTTFNTGTGVIENYRGRKLIDQLYAAALPIWKKSGVTQSNLEVLASNDIAIRVYERVGFAKCRKLHCYKTTINQKEVDVIAEQMDIDIMLNIPQIDQSMYSWDYTNNALKQSPGNIRAYAVINTSNTMIGYFSLNEAHRSICQLELVEEDSLEEWKALLNGISQIWEGSLKLNNVDYRRINLIQALKELKWDNHVDQFEMQMSF